MESNIHPEAKLFPIIQLARFYDSYLTTRVSSRIAHTFEVSVYADKCNGTLFINQTPYELRRGYVRFITPGTTLSSTGNYTCYSMRFDFLDNESAMQTELIKSIPPFFFCGEQMLKDAESIVSLSSSDQTGSRLLVNAMLMKLLYQFYTLSAYGRITSPAVRRCIEYMETHYMEPITLEDIGKLTGYVPLHAMRIFKDATGKTPHEYLCSLRLTHARKLLGSTSFSIEEIAFQCGFRSTSHFQTLFRKRFGITPHKFRKSAEKLEF